MNRFLIQIPLPDGAAWTMEPSRDWVALRHAPSESEIRLSIFRADTVSNARKCEQSARALDPHIPRVGPGQLLDEREVRAPEGFDTVVRLGTLPPQDHALEGLAVGFGGNARRCLVVVFRTRVDGPAPLRRVLSRLEFFVSRILARTRNWDIDARVQRRSPGS